MSNLKLLRKILRLKNMKVTRFEFKGHGQELHLTVKPHKNGCRCPECGRRGRIVAAGGQPRSWQDIAVLGVRVILWYAPKEIHCPTHGRAQEEIPWAAAFSRITYRSEWRICRLCQSMTQKAAAELLCMPTSTLCSSSSPSFLRAPAGRAPWYFHVPRLHCVGISLKCYWETRIEPMYCLSFVSDRQWDLSYPGTRIGGFAFCLLTACRN